jgi:hypothetical protein
LLTCIARIRTCIRKRSQSAHADAVTHAARASSARSQVIADAAADTVTGIWI